MTPETRSKVQAFHDGCVKFRDFMRSFQNAFTFALVWYLSYTIGGYPIDIRIFQRP